MDSLNASQIRQLLGQLLTPDPSKFLKANAAGTSGQSPASGLHQALSGTTQLQLPPALRQILAQAQSPADALKSLQAMKLSAETPPQLRAIVEQVLSSAKQTTFNKTTVNQWFGLNVTALLSQPPVPSSSTSSNSWLQLMVPLLLVALKQGGAARAEGKSTPSNALGNALSQLFGSGNNAQQLLQSLRELQGAVQQARLSQIQLADSLGRNEPDYFMNIPWHVEDEHRNIELLLQRRKKQRQQEEGEDVWLLSLRLNVNRTGPMLARVRWDGTEAQVTIYTDNETATRWLRPHLSHLEQELQNKGINLASLATQTGRIPATLAPDPNQLIRVKV
ncbi:MULTISPECIES: flagellar hook-length control protein FliK [Gammaproteobacteria]|uniref:flagellar hook-length control protein FliK n=1 Tax=Gammaproteobacteria TaxID=1236 RepID=UPI000DCF8E43|nr:MULTISPECIES: flagellar hook-length control protein FliK [Gammaproteobacteria]RTE86118.1 flagellar hook-length control protein FliK [Aliidiomarina sp. B3213]TCZ91471.1 flagellar hook-length control protein FliK [Lysobacter sp. N42]